MIHTVEEDWGKQAGLPLGNVLLQEEMLVCV